MRLWFPGALYNSPSSRLLSCVIIHFVVIIIVIIVIMFTIMMMMMTMLIYSIFNRSTPLPCYQSISQSISQPLLPLVSQSVNLPINQSSHISSLVSNHDECGKCTSKTIHDWLATICHEEYLQEKITIGDVLLIYEFLTMFWKV